MKLFATLSRRLPWLNLPGACLIALLQRTPAVRVAAVAADCVRAAPLGAVLRSAAAAAAALGAVHTLAGATQVVASTNSVNITVGTPLTPPVAFTTNFPGGGLTVGAYIITGLPPGLTVPGLNPATNILNVTNSTGSGIITGTPTLAGSYTTTIQAWEFSGASGSSTVPIQILFTIAPAGATALSIDSPPVSLTSVVGEPATFTVGVTANPPAAYQWFKNGAPIANATGASLAIPIVALADAGDYFVQVTNSLGTKQSATATLVVKTLSSPPEFTAQPASQTVASGATVVFTAIVNGVPTPALQWKRDGALIANATNAQLVLTGASVIAGSYTVTAVNSSASVTSKVAQLSLSSSADIGRLTNLSILTSIAASDPFFTVGTVLGGGAPTARKPLLVRAVGPSLAPLNVPGVLGDPKLTLFDGASAKIAENDNWGGDAGLKAVFTQVGAFPFVSDQSNDAAVYNSATPAGSYTVQVSGAGGSTGTVIAELYDATPAGTFNASTSRLIDVSVLKTIPPGGRLTAGFTVGGATAKTVLVRAIGPGLAQLGVGGFLPDPKLTLFNNNTGTKITENDNWGGDAQLRAAMSAVGAFALADPASKDAVLLLTLPPGGYSALAEGVGNATGAVIVEIYEVP